MCDRNGSGRQEDGWEKCIPARGATACHVAGHRDVIAGRCDVIAGRCDVDTGVARRHARFWHANATRRGKFADHRPHNWARHAILSHSYTGTIRHVYPGADRYARTTDRWRNQVTGAPHRQADRHTTAAHDQSHQHTQGPHRQSDPHTAAHNAAIRSNRHAC